MVGYLVIPELRSLRQEDFFEFKASLACIVKSRIAWVLEQDPVSKTL